jgi:CRISPR type III-A/MTUBE-associated protein Csm6
MSYVLFSAIGDTDPVRGGFDGPMLHIVRKYHPAKVYLFLTADMSKRDGDTNCYERAIHHVAPECEVVKYPTDIKNASDFDAFHDLFDGIIGEIHAQNPDSEILVNISSATPQIKTTMCLEAVSNHVPLTPVQVTNPENKTGKDTKHFDPYKDDLDYELENSLDNLADAPDRCSTPDILSFKKGMIKNQIKSLIGNYDYKGAYGLISENRRMFPKSAIDLLEHAHSRSKPDNKKAKKIARDSGLYEDLYPISESRASRACEYYLIMRIKCLRGEMSDVLLRILPLAEYLALDIMKANRFDMQTIAWHKPDDEQWSMDRAKAGQNAPGLMEYLDAQYNGGYKASSVNVRTFSYIMEFLKLDNEILKDFGYIAKWIPHRHEVAHKLTAVTEDDLKDLKGTGSAPDELCASFERLMRAAYKNSLKGRVFGIYDHINSQVTEALDRKLTE